MSREKVAVAANCRVQQQQQSSHYFIARARVAYETGWYVGKECGNIVLKLCHSPIMSVKIRLQGSAKRLGQVV